MYRFSDYVAKREAYSPEQAILSKLPYMNMVQQALLDMRLHKRAIARGDFAKDNDILFNDTTWKQSFIDIMQGKQRDPVVIQKTIDVIKRDIESHLNRTPGLKTGSKVWHDAWINVYRQWLSQLQKILGDLHGTQG